MKRRTVAICGLSIALILAPGLSPPGSGQGKPLPPLMASLKSSETAIVLVDFQNNFAQLDGEHYPKLKAEYERTGMLENAVDLVRAARSMGILVVQVMEGYRPDYSELDWTNPGTFHRSQIARNAWKMGTPPVELYAPLRPGPGDGDILLPNRAHVSGFGGNKLDYILRSRGIKNLGVGGFTTEGCVYATVLAAYDLGYHVYALKDVMVSPEAEISDLFFAKLYPKYSKVMGYQNFLRMSKGQKAAPE